MCLGFEQVQRGGSQGVLSIRCGNQFDGVSDSGRLTSAWSPRREQRFQMLLCIDRVSPYHLRGLAACLLPHSRAAKIECRSSPSPVWFAIALQQLTSDTLKAQSWKAHTIVSIRAGFYGIMSGRYLHNDQINECPVLRAIMSAQVAASLCRVAHNMPQVTGSCCRALHALWACATSIARPVSLSCCLTSSRGASLRQPRWRP